MLFRKKQPRACEYCKFSTPMGEDGFLCEKRGIRIDAKPCHSFRYDPCKRIPPQNIIFDPTKYSQEDFKL